MTQRLALALLTASIASCAAPRTQDDRRDEDAAPLYRALDKRFPKLPPIVGAAFDREKTNAADLDAAVAAFDPLLEELSRAARCRRCVWINDPPPTILSGVPLDYALTAGKLLVVRSRRRLENGNDRGCLEDLLILQQFGSDLLQMRSTIGKLLGVIAGHWAGWELQDLLAARRLDQAGLELATERLATLLRRVPPQTAFLRDERTMAVPLLDEIRDLGLDEVVRRVGGDMKKPEETPPFVADWHRWLQETLRKDMEGAKRRISARWDELIVPLEEAHRKPINSGELTRGMAALKEGSHALSNRMARRTLGIAPKDDDGLNDAADLLFRLWVPALEKAVQRLAEYRLLLETIHLACSLELLRLSSGSYPGTPGDLPGDPFVGGSILYRRIVRPDGEGYVLGAAGRADNAEERMRVYSEECAFDRERFDKKGYGDSEVLTFGVFHRR